MRGMTGGGKGKGEQEWEGTREAEKKGEGRRGGERILPTMKMMKSWIRHWACTIIC